MDEQSREALVLTLDMDVTEWPVVVVIDHPAAP
jgi:hypothetical protein